MLERRKETEERFHSDWANLSRYQDDSGDLGVSNEGWEQVEQMREEELEERLYGAAPQPAAQRPLPDPVPMDRQERLAPPS